MEINDKFLNNGDAFPLLGKLELQVINDSTKLKRLNASKFE
jgi:hypothetical protein